MHVETAIDSKSHATGVSSRVRQTPKSIATHHRIIDAAIRCFLEFGYHRTTTSEIAKQAGVTRGAVQYYFPTTPEVLRATTEYIIQHFLADVVSAISAHRHEGGESLDLAADTLWRAAHSPLWIVWKELEAAARTDKELQPVMIAAMTNFTQRWEQAAKDHYGSFLALDPVKFEMGRNLAWHFLQSLAGNGYGETEENRALKSRLLNEFKRLMRHYWGLPS